MADGPEKSPHRAPWERVEALRAIWGLFFGWTSRRRSTASLDRVRSLMEHQARVEESARLQRIADAEDVRLGDATSRVASPPAAVSGTPTQDSTPDHPKEATSQP